MNRRILVSVMVIGLVGALAGSSTMALFNDSETIGNNQFTAGELDLKIDWDESYNGEHVETQNLTNNPGTIFDFEDIKPGDHGEATISLHLEDNPGWIWMNLNQTSNWDNACTEPEREAEGQCGSEGELDEELEFVIWSDDGDNVLQEDENVIFEGTAEELGEQSEEGILLDGNPSTNETEAFPGQEAGYIGVKWSLPLETGNQVQGDSASYDVNFYTEQRRHNDNPDNPWEEPDNETEEPEEPQNETGDNETEEPEHPGNETPVDDNETDDTYYQVDFVGGEPINDLSESTYSSEGRMQRYMHGGPDNPVDNESESDMVKTGTGGPDCVDSEPFTVNTEENTATVDFQVNNITPECATGTEVSLVSYEKPHPGWIPERADEQDLFDHETERFDPGNHSMTIDIPDVSGEESSEEPENGSDDENESESPTTCEEPENSSMEHSADDIAQAKYGYNFEGLSEETSCEVEELFNNQPFAEGLDPVDVMTREEISQEKFSMPYDEISSDSASEVEQDYQDQFAEEETADYTATQDGETIEIEALSGDMPVEELYDFRLPDRYDNEADNNATNGASYGSGPYYGSAGTEDLQQGDTSIMFLYDGPEGLSLVVVHEGVGSNDGGSATFEITDLNGDGEWVVKDDLYLDSDGTLASSNYDRWNTSSNPQTIDWTWGSGGSDGGAFSTLSEDFEFTINPAFNEEAGLYDDNFYDGEVDEWEVLSGDRNNPDRTTLDMNEEVTVSAE